MNKSVTASLFLDTRSKSLDKNEGMIKVNVYHNYKNRLFTTGKKAFKKEWDILQRSIDENGLSGKVKNEYIINMYERLYQSPDSDLNRAKQIIKDLDSKFSFEAFKICFEDKNYKQKTDSKQIITDVIVALQNTSEVLMQNNQIKTAGGYMFAAKSLVRFLDTLSLKQRINLNLPPIQSDTSLPFASLNAYFLNEYEKWMLKAGKLQKSINKKPSPATTTTIGIYLRYVRSAYNSAIKEGVVGTESYPFGKREYTIPGSQNKKKAITKQDVNKILAYQPIPETFEDRSWSLWVFSYLSNGMNLSDICRLKKEDVDYINNKITFIRNKTLRSKKANQAPITTNLFPILIPIIERYKSNNPASPYLFSFLDSATDENSIINTIMQLVKVTNYNMKKIAEKLEINANLNTYTARHTFATILLRSGASIPFISQSLGHNNIQTTQSYLGSFEDEQTKEFLNALI